jgi:myosin heavy subunit
LGKTKIFFKTGILATLEESRDMAISKIIVSFQSHIRIYLIKINFKKIVEKRCAVNVLQRNFKSYLKFQNCGWFNLFGNVKLLFQNSKKKVKKFFLNLPFTSVNLSFTFHSSKLN